MVKAYGVDRIRDLCSLGHLTAIVFGDEKQSSRCVERRCRRRAHEDGLCNQTIDALNSLEGCRASDGTGGANLAQQKVQGRVVGAIKALGPCPADLTPAGAHRELREACVSQTLTSRPTSILPWPCLLWGVSPSLWRTYTVLAVRNLWKGGSMPICSQPRRLGKELSPKVLESPILMRSCGRVLASMLAS